MRAAAFVLGLALIGSAAAAADPADLVGEWTVDLRPTPDAPAYYQPMTFVEKDGSIVATFYGSSGLELRFNAEFGALHFAFVTRDRSGPYNHSGVLLPDGTITGRTHSIGRDFLSVWTARRADATE
ncbi:MAG: hypothetical protein AAFV51_06130 [Pseudomonadota bacterium]